jgi:riboflavin kinase/FMN adenylyltransferase
MKLLRDLDSCPEIRGGAVSIGNFDGVHRGHQEIAQRLVRMARRFGGPSVVLTFDPPPSAILRPAQTPARLTTVETRAELLAQCGVDWVVAYPTDRALLELTPEEFFASIVRRRLNVRGMVEGPNFFFGKDRTGTVESLRGLCAGEGLEFEVVAPQSVNGRMVSSSAVRGLIESGSVAEAVDLLGHGHRVTGHVVRGAARGRTLGFPTANLEGIATLLPPEGVYAGVTVGLDRPYAAAINIGANPTFGEGAMKFEAHLIGYQGDLYGMSLSIDLRFRIRPTQRFNGPEELKKQLQRDIAQASKTLGSTS